MALSLNDFLLFGEELAAPKEVPTLDSGLGSLADTLSGGGDFLRPIPTPREFINDPYFVGSLASDADALPDAIKESWIEEASSKYNELILAGCVAGDTLIQLADGRLEPIRDLVGTTPKIITAGGQVCDTASISSSGIKSVMRLSLDGGQSVVLTPDHLVKTWSNGEDMWRPAAALKADDLVAVSRTRQFPEATSDITPAGARVLGYMLTDGYAGPTQMSYCDGCPGSHSDFVAALSELGFEGTTRPHSTAKAWVTSVKNYQRSGFKAWLERHGYPTQGGDKSAYVRVPEAVLTATPEAVAAFLQAVWSAEGCVFQGTPKAPTARLYLAMQSERFIRGVYELLARFDVRARLRHTFYTDKRNGRHGDIWALVISGGAVLTFFDKVGLVPGKEDRCAQVRAFVSCRQRKARSDMLPVTERWVFDTAQKITGVPSRSRNLCFDRRTLYSRERFARVSAGMGFAFQQQVTAKFSDAVGYERVKSIVTLEDPEETFDLEVHGAHEFSGGGIALHNSIGCYKSQRAAIHLMYLAAVTLCLRDPGAYYGLGSKASMTMAIVSISKEKAKEVAFNRLRQFIYGSPFFMENPLNRPDRAFKGQLKFKNGVDIRPAVANEGGVLGNALIGLVIDEAAFMNVTEKSKKARGDDTTYDAAATIYSQARIRMKSRFMREGKPFPCKVIIASSAQFPDDFVSRRQLELVQDPDPTAMVSDLSIWQAKPNHFSKQTFRVEIGAESRFSRILDEDDDANPAARVIDVPINLREDFERDIDRSIRDLAGIPLLTLAPLITDRSKVIASYRSEEKASKDWECVHPFSVEETTLLDGKFNRYLVCDQNPSDSMWYPKKNPHATRFIHIDPSFGKQDATGFCMGHATGFEMVREKDHKTGQMLEKYNVSVYVDLMLRIVRPDQAGSEINWSDIEALIRSLQDCGYEIGLITTDGVGAFLVQRLKQQGFDSEILSVDRTLDPYMTLRSCFQEGRISMYEYPHVESELFGLEWNKKRNKVDHSRRGKKDVADALAGMVYSAVTRYFEYDAASSSISAKML